MPAKGWLGEFLLGDEGRLARQHRRDDDRVHVARVIEQDDGVALRQLLGAGHVHADAGQREHRARDAAQRGPARRQRRQDHRRDEGRDESRAP